MIHVLHVAHQRELIRKAVVAQLVAANTAAGQRVQSTRVEPHKRSQLPSISVYALRELVEVASATSSPRELEREIKLEVVGWVAHSETLPIDDAMDAMAEQIEAAMEADPYFGRTAADSNLEETTMQVVEDDGRSDPMIGIVTMAYSVRYRSTEAGPVGLEDFLVAGASHARTNGVEDTAPATDLINVQENT